MSGFAVVPEVWASAGKGIGDASDVLAGGVDAFCFALGGGSPFGGDPLGEAAFAGSQGSPGFAKVRDGLIRDLAAAVNLLRGVRKGLVDSAGRYVEADGTIVDELLGSGRPQPGRAAAPEPVYTPPAVPGGLPTTVPAPPVWEQAAWILEAVAMGCPWPDGDVDGVRRLRDAALAMGRVVREVAADVAGHSRRVTGSGDGPATEAFASASRVVHGPGGLLADLESRCDRLAGYCDDGAHAILASRWQCVTSAVFVIALMAAGGALGGWVEGLVLPWIRLEGAALRVVLRVIREALLSGAFTSGLDLIGQLFHGDELDLGELLKALWQGTVAGGLMGGAHATLPQAARRTPALASLGRLMESSGPSGYATRLAVGGTVGTAAIAASQAVSGDPVDLTHAAETGFGMAFTGAGADLARRAFHRPDPAPAAAEPDAGHPLEAGPTSRTDDGTGPPPRTLLASDTVGDAVPPAPVDHDGSAVLDPPDGPGPASPMAHVAGPETPAPERPSPPKDDPAGATPPPPAGAEPAQTTPGTPATPRTGSAGTTPGPHPTTHTAPPETTPDPHPTTHTAPPGTTPDTAVRTQPPQTAPHGAEPAQSTSAVHTGPGETTPGPHPAARAEPAGTTPDTPIRTEPAPASSAAAHAGPAPIAPGLHPVAHMGPAEAGHHASPSASPVTSLDAVPGHPHDRPADGGSGPVERWGGDPRHADGAGAVVSAHPGDAAVVPPAVPRLPFHGYDRSMAELDTSLVTREARAAVDRAKAAVVESGLPPVEQRAWSDRLDLVQDRAQKVDEIAHLYRTLDPRDYDPTPLGDALRDYADAIEVYTGPGGDEVRLLHPLDLGAAASRPAQVVGGRLSIVDQEIAYGLIDRIRPDLAADFRRLLLDGNVHVLTGPREPAPGDLSCERSPAPAGTLAGIPTGVALVHGLPAEMHVRGGGSLADVVARTVHLLDHTARLMDRFDGHTLPDSWEARGELAADGFRELSTDADRRRLLEEEHRQAGDPGPGTHARVARRLHRLLNDDPVDWRHWNDYRDRLDAIAAHAPHRLTAVDRAIEEHRASGHPDLTELRRLVDATYAPVARDRPALLNEAWTTVLDSLGSPYGWSPHRVAARLFAEAPPVYEAMRRDLDPGLHDRDAGRIDGFRELVTRHVATWLRDGLAADPGRARMIDELRLSQASLTQRLMRELEHDAPESEHYLRDFIDDRIAARLDHELRPALLDRLPGRRLNADLTAIRNAPQVYRDLLWDLHDRLRDDPSAFDRRRRLGSRPTGEPDRDLLHRFLQPYTQRACRG